ncbi:hypothetical protein [Desulfuromonas soudanensis]|uniref:hypothetical protein n=1 Tax=Desulfuromonas soudanensis TaxID=1603606 RepID=UPI0006AD2FA7|nr:hypothetical protein [Desulfuromonas soudanensis]
MKATIATSALGVGGGLGTLLSAPPCVGTSCPSCFGCVGAGGLALVLSALALYKKTKEKRNGVAQTGH